MQCSVNKAIFGTDIVELIENMVYLVIGLRDNVESVTHEERRIDK